MIVEKQSLMIDKKSRESELPSFDVYANSLADVSAVFAKEYAQEVQYYT